MTAPVLVTIPPSHYCEKARWALDRARVAYREEGHAPLVHYLFVLPRSRSRTVPILFRDGHAPITESSDIIRFADESLAPHERLFPSEPPLAEEVESWVKRFDDELGPPIRRHAYCYIAKDRDLFLDVFEGTLSPGERLVVRGGQSLFRAALRKAFAVSDRAIDKTRRQVEAVFDDVSRTLSDGRPFLTGERFTAADLTFAALAAPLLAPPIRASLLPARLAETTRVAQATPAGALGVRLLAERKKPV